MGRLAGVLLGIAFTVLAAGAHAADAPAPAPPPPSFAPGWFSGQPPPPPPPPPGGFAPYPPAYAAPYGYANAGPPPGVFLYETQKKNEMLALLIEFFIPGVGSIYADHVAGAILTWAATVGGFALLFWWFGSNIDRDTGSSNGTVGSPDGPRDTWALYLGLGLVIGGRIYGLVDSYTSARDFNRRLRARLGLPEYAMVGVVPIRTDRAVSWGPSLSLRF